MDTGAWQTTVHRVAKSQTPLKWLRTHACNRHDTELFPRKQTPTLSTKYISFLMILLQPPSVTTSVNTNLHFTFCSILFKVLFPKGISTVQVFCTHSVFAWNGPPCISTHLISAHLSKSSAAVTPLLISPQILLGYMLYVVWKYLYFFPIKL